jgi:long-chain acyl-CoA synthetase
LGELRADGLLKITGRKKDLFKTGKGKYVAPAPIENLLNACPLVEASLVSGVGQQAPYGLVVLSEHVRAAMSDATQRQEVLDTLKALLHKINAGLPDYEQLRMIVVAKQPWSVANNCLTPTLKIKRAQIEALVGSHVERWYQHAEPVVFAD